MIICVTNKAPTIIIIIIIVILIRKTAVNGHEKSVARAIIARVHRGAPTNCTRGLARFEADGRRGNARKY